MIKNTVFARIFLLLFILLFMVGCTYSVQNDLNTTTPIPITANTSQTSVGRVATLSPLPSAIIETGVKQISTVSPLDTLPTFVPSPTGTLTKQQQDSFNGVFIGQKIVVAIESFNRDNGFYPQRIGELVPDYLETIPTAPTGQEYTYVLFGLNNDGPFEGYRLSFDSLSRKWGCSYFSSDQLWECSFNPEDALPTITETRSVQTP